MGCGEPPFSYLVVLHNFLIDFCAILHIDFFLKLYYNYLTKAKESRYEN